MKKWIKRSLWAVMGFVLLAAAVLVVGVFLGERKMSRVVAVDVAPLAVSLDASAIAQGRYLYATRGCADCHGASGAGKVVIDEGGLYVASPNLTQGAGSVTRGYRNEDWVRVIRHGLKPNSQPVMIMPSEDYSRLSDPDTAALIAYIATLAPVPGSPAVIHLPAPVKALYAFGVVRDAAEKIAHTMVPPVPVEPGPTLEHGAYVANTCIGCHGPGLSGGKIPGAPPSWPAAANLTPGANSAMARYATPQAFAAMMRSGVRPDGTRVSQVMPFAALGAMNDVDLKALHMYLRSVAPRDAGQR